MLKINRVFETRLSYLLKFVFLRPSGAPTTLVWCVSDGSKIRIGLDWSTARIEGFFVLHDNNFCVYSIIFRPYKNNKKLKYFAFHF